MILQINFNLNVPAAEYQKMADSVAHAFLDVPGLTWKIWLLNPAAQEAGGIYLFDSQASLDAYVNGPLVAQLRGLTAVRNISIKQFEVMPGATALTRGPFEKAMTSEA
ncbi:MAG TPA: YdhR family protein [Candidatus Acidoferrales bacterium]|nr:YdhR family protein [Candidatus Acidoferrales bacterium]